MQVLSSAAAGGSGVQQHESSDADLPATDGRIIHDLLHKATFMPLTPAKWGRYAADAAQLPPSVFRQPSCRRPWRVDASPCLSTDAFVFFDESRCRGADMKMRGDAMALLNLAPKLCRNAVMQALAARALKKDKIFRPKLAGVNLRACAVYVLTAPLPSGQQAPVAGDESGSHVVQLKGAATVKDTAGSAPFFLRVRLPDAAPPKLSSVVQLVELSATDPLSIFAAAVAAAEVDETQHTITLGGGAEWRDMRSNVLFVRDFYPALWEGVLNKGRSLPFVLTGGAIIIGTPGIAKSAFGLYALFRAIKEGRTVVYHSFQGGFAVFKGGKAYKRTAAVDLDSLAELRDANTLYISDGIPPVESNGFTLLVSSPKRAIWSKFSQSPGHPQLLLPPMRREEIMALRRLAFADAPGCDEAAVEHRFNLWGGSARNVLTYGWDEMWQTQLEQAPVKLSLEKLKEALSTASSFNSAVNEDQFHRVLDLIPNGAVAGSTLKPSERSFYAFHHAQLSSQYVAGKFAARMMSVSRKQFIAFLHELGTDPAAGTFHGKLYERTIVAARLQRARREKDTDMTLVRLSPDAASKPHALLDGVAQLDLGAGLRLVRFNTPDDLAAAWAATPGDAAFMPFHLRFPVVDILLRLHNQPLLLNSTVGDKHDIKVQNKTFRAVLDAVGLGKGSAVIPLLWVLPESSFADFKSPGPFKPKAAESSALAQRIVQYKLLVDIPPSPYRPAGATPPAPSAGNGALK